MQSEVHVSRHFLDRQASHVRFVPFAEAGPLEDAAPGTMLAHRLFVTGGWRQDYRVGSRKLRQQSASRLDPMRSEFIRSSAATYRQHS